MQLKHLSQTVVWLKEAVCILAVESMANAFDTESGCTSDDRILDQNFKSK